jgi:eukaryotic-like serine/threonine-protein kinase
MPTKKEDESQIEELQRIIGVLKADKFSLEKDLDAANQRNQVLQTENGKLSSDLAAMHREKTALAGRIETLEQEKDTLNSRIGGLQTTVAALQKDNADALGRVAGLEAEVSRPKLSPEQLSASLGSALRRMEEGLSEVQGRVGYTVARFETEIKAALAVGEDNVAFVKLPYLGETVSPEALSVIKLAFKVVPAARVPLTPVPNLIGRTQAEAVRILEDLQLKPQIKSQPSPTKTGIVIAQDPEPGSEVAPENAVTLTVAVPLKVKVPDLINMAREIAEKVVREAGLILGKVERQWSEASQDIVIGQTPAAGTEAAKGSAVDLVVAMHAIRVPDVKGMKEREAKAALEKKRLKVGSIEYQKSKLEDGVVLVQSPAAGEWVAEGTSINLVVAKKITRG